MKEVFNGSLRRVVVRKTIETAYIVNVGSDADAEAVVQEIKKQAVGSALPGCASGTVRPFPPGGQTYITGMEIDSTNICDGSVKRVFQFNGVQPADGCDLTDIIWPE